jgi:hypothetical protein
MMVDGKITGGCVMVALAVTVVAGVTVDVEVIANAGVMVDVGVTEAVAVIGDAGVLVRAAVVLGANSGVGVTVGIKERTLLVAVTVTVTGLAMSTRKAAIHASISSWYQVQVVLQLTRVTVSLTGRLPTRG